MSKQTTIEVSALSKVNDTHVSFTEKKTIVIENIHAWTLKDLTNRRASLEKAVVDTQAKQAADVAKADDAINILNAQIAAIDEKIAEAKAMGLKEDDE